MKFAFIIDPIERLDPCHDSSVALMEAAQQLGHEVWITQASHLSVADGKAWAFLQPVTLVPIELKDGRWVAADSWFTSGESALQPLEEMDAVFMRSDPPVTIAYLYATYILDYVDPSKTQVINSPQGLRAANEKMYALQFTEAIPDTIVSQDKSVIRAAVERWGGTGVLKPLGGKAGEGILFLAAGDRNFNSMIEISTDQGKTPIMVQTYLPAAKEGDKRIILINGEPLGAVNRIPTGSDFRGNMAVGGRIDQATITDREREICSLLAPTLRRDGLIFVGIDVIGGYLTEVNVTSPTGIREIDRLDGVRLGQQMIEWMVNSQARQQE
ncbi:MAG: glutathione synthase [Leptolyngbyaceae cyanobacterium SM1_1_3]|nr:glutathione synthase [Leptolyngbyaceae cyanobacterium SM1_1_3]NJM84831.1 glutathione synthase [Leptolyngbyaceae cyanobacterium RM2_2_21]NJN03642.1 glutathione synthase [Leptolyngbyaceae cyanobacterium RM1_1_2]NJO10100.1 glutathione synthase [Leptolyngbyaceae cyanobacterium SL_1_1]